jgi:hypothetical protein
MLFALPYDLENRLIGIFLGLVVGTVVTWVVARWRLAQARRSVLQGDAGDTVAIELHLVERAEGGDGLPVPVRLRRRYLGQQTLNEVVANPHLARELQKRVRGVTEHNALISMEGATGSYLLETLCGFVCDRAHNGPFDHEVYVMAPCREPDRLAHHKPISVILIAVKDLELFLRWEAVSRIEVEHASDGIRIVTLMDLARRWKEEQSAIAEARAAGRSVRDMETMFVLDLALDARSAPLPTRRIPWQRFAVVLKERGMDYPTTEHPLP